MSQPTAMSVTLSQFLVWAQTRGVELHRVNIGEAPQPVTAAEQINLCREFETWMGQQLG